MENYLGPGRRARFKLGLLVMGRVGSQVKKRLLCWAMVVHTFNTSTREAEECGSL